MSKSTRSLSGRILRTPKDFDQEHVKKLIQEMIRMNKQELMDSIKNPAASCLCLAIGSIIVSAIRDADTQKLNFLLERSIGKVKENIAVEFTPTVQYITEINSDGNLIQSVIKDEPLPERNITIDLTQIDEEERK